MNNKRSMQLLSGLATARGLAVGSVFIYRGYDDIPIPEYVVDFGCEGDELLRFKRAINEAKRDLESLIAVLKKRSGREDVKVFECHEMLLEDPMMVDGVSKLIIGRRVNAESAVMQVIGKYRAQFERMNDPYFRSRVRDIDDVERRLIKALTGYAVNPCLELKTPSIVIADDLTPSETMQLPQEYLLGFATNGGSTTSHVALLARAMGIPAVTGLGDIVSRVNAGDVVCLDGSSGEVIISPDDATIEKYAGLVARQNDLFAVDVLKDRPAGTMKDGGDVLIYANVHPGVPMDTLKDLGARGIGLYRSEYLWLNAEGEPSEEEQFKAYLEVAEFAKTLSPKSTVTIRALDIGGDKIVRGIAQVTNLAKKESNPFLGNRSIRYLLSHRDVMHTQLRAILRASKVGNVCMMYPMVSCVEELEIAAEALEAAKRSLDVDGLEYDHNIPIGIMIEVPAAALNASALAKYVRFFSIGTNDLVQYTMAADRTNDAVSNLYQPLNPAVIKLMEMTVNAAKENKIYVGVCGESAADPTIGLLWASMGADILSMSATYIPAMAKVLSEMTHADLNEYRERVLEMATSGITASEIMRQCREWLIAKFPALDLTFA